MISCQYCKQEIVGIKYKTYKRKRYHYDCFVLLQKEAENKDSLKKSKCSDQTYKDLTSAICSLFDLQSLPVFIEKQLEDFASKYGYTFYGMQMSLEYFYTVKSHPVPQSATVGIIPYIYDEAKQYFEVIARANISNAKAVLEDKTSAANILPPNCSLLKINLEDL